MGNIQEKIEIKRAATPQEQNSIYRFRYHVYANLLGYDIPNDDGPIIVDSFDETAINFYLEKNSEMIGVIRANIVNLDTVDETFEQTFSVRKFKEKHHEILYASKLILHPDHRQINCLTMLCEAVDAYSRAMRIKLNLVECRTELLPLYKFMGFKEHHQSHIDSIFGELIPLVLVADE